MASGQRINSSKFVIVFGRGVEDETKRDICHALHMNQGGRLSKYLGLPGDWPRSKTQALNWLKDRVWTRLQGWKEKYLSPAGKEVLIKSVIQAIPTYIMSLFMLPKSFCGRISSMIANFWWRQMGKDRGIHWKSWQQLLLSKKEGGLGFRDLHAMNLALVAKQVWRIYRSPNTLWARIIKSLYFPNGSIWEAKRRTRASWGWQSLIQGRDFLNKHKAWMIKSGEKVKICGDQWTQSGQRIWGLQSHDHDLTVSNLLKDDLTGWDELKLSSLLSRDDAREVRATQINVFLDQDSPIWPFTKDGGYSVKTGYHVTAGDIYGADRASSSVPNGDDSMWREVWNAKVQPKIRHFIWKLLSNSLPTKVNLVKRRCGSDNLCPICSLAPESSLHLFTECDG